MKLLRKPLWLAVALALALPVQQSGAMLRRDVAQPEAEGQSEEAGREVVAAEVARDPRRQEAAQVGGMNQRLGGASRTRQQRMMTAAAFMATVSVDAEERPAVARQLAASSALTDIVPDDQLRDVVAEAVATPSNSASTSDTAAAAVAGEASEAAKPKRSKVRHGEAVLAQADLHAARARHNLPAEGTPSSDARIPATDRSAQQPRQSEVDLALALADRDSAKAQRGFNPVLGSAKDRRAVVLRALAEAQALLPKSDRPYVGQMPADLAAALADLAHRGDRFVETVVDGKTVRTREALLPRLASDSDGIDVGLLDSPVTAEPIQRVQALQSLADAAAAAAKDYKKGTPLRRALETQARDALADRDALVLYLQDVAMHYPSAAASVQVSADALSSFRVGQGGNSAPQAMRFDFGHDSVPVAGPFNAVFKRTETTLKADGSLGETGVDTSGEAPLRLEQRSVATRRLAELLGIGPLVVDMRIARLGTGADSMGLIMEKANGEAGIVQVEGPPDPGERTKFLDVTALKAEADAMLAYIDGGRVDDVPVTPLSAKTEPKLGSWLRDNWAERSAFLDRALKDLAVREVSRGGQKTVVGITQARALSDAHLQDASFRQQLSNAQWLDLLCGQVDRHMYNLFVDTSGRNPVVKLIDNDLAFGQDNKKYGLDVPGATPNFRLPPKPLAIDAAFKRALLSLSENQLRDATAGLLIKAEQDALVGRLLMLQQYVADPAVREVYMPGAASPSTGLSWGGDPATLFRGHDNPDINANSGEYSYYSLLQALPIRQ